MAQKVHIILVDDLDGSDASQTVSFGLDGANYEIDLNDEHADALREALAPYLGHARKVSRGGARKAKSPAAAGGASAKEIRDWARSNGFEVPDRGRIPTDVREAFDAAN
ncbi:histone-like nucleoid-structuring protein Lsr2 [Nocardioides sambongensis]|uniref:histone-like nucleoid-structuring protein Lsr2 n=1 Tax=Nocardioides sambongensis TaxID=2589074 RepID=UPI0011260E24|nr:Lsr2 family protein [Nocardioides sambongensis]